MHFGAISYILMHKITLLTNTSFFPIFKQLTLSNIESRENITIIPLLSIFLREIINLEFYLNQAYLYFNDNIKFTRLTFILKF